MMDDLKHEKGLVHSRMRITLKKIEVAQQLLNDLNFRMMKDRVVYEKLDRELAMIDGRYHKVTTVVKKEEKKIDGFKMTREQIIELAKTLGVEVNI
jgi:hypothetical protein